MAFDNDFLTVIAVGAGQTIYSYSTEDTINTITADGTYFGTDMDGTNGQMRVGDLILAITGTAGAGVPAIFAVQAVATGRVTVSAVTTLVDFS